MSNLNKLKKALPFASMFLVGLVSLPAVADFSLYRNLVVDNQAPTDLRLEAYDDNSNGHVFLEKPCFELQSDIVVDVLGNEPGIYDSAGDTDNTGGIISAGTQVACVMIHADSDIPLNNQSIKYRGIVEFDSDVEGIIVGTNNLNNSDSECDTGRITYPVGASRGLELDAATQDMFGYSRSPADTIRFQKRTFHKMDQIRVILSCPDAPLQPEVAPALVFGANQ